MHEDPVRVPRNGMRGQGAMIHPPALFAPVVAIVAGSRASGASVAGHLSRLSVRVEIHASLHLLLEKAAGQRLLCVIIIDPPEGDADAFTAQRKLREAGSSPCFVQLLTGPHGVVTFSPALGRLESTVRAALAHDAAQDAEWLERAALQGRYDSLTPREREVFAFVVGGLLIKQLAAAIGTREITAKVHKGRVMAKMRARSVADLVWMATKLGIAPRRAC
jgi:DNA-binding NarL/FixJ family response regulator